MTNQEIIKALEWLKGDNVPCASCAYHQHGFSMCWRTAVQDAIDLITRQQAEIERLKEENQKLRLEMSYMSGNNSIGDKHEMGCW